MIGLILAIAVAQPKVQDDGFGVCPAFTHYHESADEAQKKLHDKLGGDWTLQTGEALLDGQCHDDMDEHVVKPRKPLPKPYKPDPRAKWL